MSNDERLAARRHLVDDVMSMACAADDNCRRNTIKARKITEIAVDSWEPRFENMSVPEIKESLTRSVRRKMRDRRDEFGFIMVITMGMVFTWIIQAMVVTIVATLIQRWLRDKDSMRRVVQ